MKNAEIFKYINSKDVRDYLINANYNFSSAEAAWLVNEHKDISLKDKINAWKSIINNMQDCQINNGNLSFPSFNSALKEYVLLLERKLLLILNNSENEYYEIVFQKTKVMDGAYGWEDRTYGIFTSYTDCFSSMIKINDFPNGPGQTRIIRKVPLNQLHSIIMGAEYNSIGEISDIFFDTGNQPLDMQVFFFTGVDLPTPFKRGDILYDPCADPLFDRLIVIGGTEKVEEKTTPSDLDSNGSSLWGYSLAPNDRPYKISRSEILFSSNYEYYPLEKINGKRRIYQIISDYLNGKTDISAFINKYNSVILEELSQEAYAIYNDASF